MPCVYKKWQSQKPTRAPKKVRLRVPRGRGGAGFRFTITDDAKGVN